MDARLIWRAIALNIGRFDASESEETWTPDDHFMITLQELFHRIVVVSSFKLQGYYGASQKHRDNTRRRIKDMNVENYWTQMRTLRESLLDLDLTASRTTPASQQFADLAATLERTCLQTPYVSTFSIAFDMNEIIQLSRILAALYPLIERLDSPFIEETYELDWESTRRALTRIDRQANAINATSIMNVNGFSLDSFYEFVIANRYRPLELVYPEEWPQMGRMTQDFYRLWKQIVVPAQHVDDAIVDAELMFDAVEEEEEAEIDLNALNLSDKPSREESYGSLKPTAHKYSDF
jgi:hypothetical protein